MTVSAEPGLNLIRRSIDAGTSQTTSLQQDEATACVGKQLMGIQ